MLLNLALNFPLQGAYAKCFHSTRAVKTLHNHSALSAVAGASRRTKWVPKNLAKLHHYRKDCVAELREVCQEKYKNETVEDKTLWKYGEEVVKRTERALGILNGTRLEKQLTLPWV